MEQTLIISQKYEVIYDQKKYNLMRVGMDGIEQKCREAEMLKDEGNNYFKSKQYVKALRCYHQAQLYINGLVDKQSPMACYSKDIIDETASKKVNELKFSIYMNMGQIYIFQLKYEKANEILNKAAEIKVNTKLKYRQAIVLMNLGSLDKSRNLFNAVLAEDPSMSTEVGHHLNKIKQNEKAQDKKSKQMYAKFFINN